MRQGGPSADAATLAKGSLQLLLQHGDALLLFLPLSFLFFLVVGGIPSFGECQGPSGSVTSKPVALNGISLQPIPTHLSHRGVVPPPSHACCLNSLWTKADFSTSLL